MPTSVVPYGYPINMLQNVVYALPPRHAYLYCDTAAATLEQSNISTMSPVTSITLDANKQAPVSGGFIRSTAGNATVILKRT